MHFGATLRLLRVNGGWTLRELAERVGVSNAYLSRVENGHDAPPTPDRLAAIARALGLSATTLVELADRVGPLTTDYLEHVPAARDLWMDIVSRDLGSLEIARVRAFIAREFPASRARAPSGLARMLDAERVIVGLACSDAQDAVDVAATKLAAATRRSARELAHAVAARERACSSALGGGLAVPHALVADVRPAAVVVTLRAPVDADTPDGAPLRALVVHVHAAGAEHARALAAMARAADARAVDAMCAARTADGVLRALSSAAGGD